MVGWNTKKSSLDLTPALMGISPAYISPTSNGTSGRLLTWNARGRLDVCNFYYRDLNSLPDVFELRNRKLEVCLVSRTGDADTRWERMAPLANKEAMAFWKNILRERRANPYVCWMIQKS
jgi:hypothetical protein